MNKYAKALCTAALAAAVSAAFTADLCASESDYTDYGIKAYKAKAEIKLYDSPKNDAKVLDTVKKGTILIPSPDDKEDSQWHEVYEIDRGDGAAYIYLLYDLPGTNAFIKHKDIVLLQSTQTSK